MREPRPECFQHSTMTRDAAWLARYRYPSSARATGAARKPSSARATEAAREPFATRKALPSINTGAKTSGHKEARLASSYERSPQHRAAPPPPPPLAYPSYITDRKSLSGCCGRPGVITRGITMKRANPTSTDSAAGGAGVGRKNAVQKWNAAPQSATVRACDPVNGSDEGARDTARGVETRVEAARAPIRAHSARERRKVSEPIGDRRGQLSRSAGCSRALGSHAGGPRCHRAAPGLGRGH